MDTGGDLEEVMPLPGGKCTRDEDFEEGLVMRLECPGEKESEGLTRRVMT